MVGKHYTPRQHIVGIKAGSSIFQDERCFDSVADLIVPLTLGVEQIFFVVSALRGETDRTIEEIAGEDAAAFNEGLHGRPNPTSERYNTTDIAARLVAPEGYCTRRVTEKLLERGVKAIALQHGPEYPLIGVDNGNYLFATPDIGASQRAMPQYDAQVVVVPGFGVRNQRGEIMCTGRGSSDLTLAQLGAVYGMNEIIYWKDTGGYWRDPARPDAGIRETVSREEVIAAGAKVLDTRIFETYNGPVRITASGRLSGGTSIPTNYSREFGTVQPLYQVAAK